MQTYEAPAKETSLGKKNYILDTGILLSSPHAILNFDEHNIFISSSTIETLCEYQTMSGERGANAREALRIINNLEKSKNEEYAILPGGGQFNIIVTPQYAESSHTQESKLPCNLPWKKKCPENDVLYTAIYLSHSDGINSAPILVSNNNVIHIKAKYFKFPVEFYKTEQVVEPMQQYKGRQILHVDKDIIDALFISNLEASLIDKHDFVENEYLILIDTLNPSHSVLAQYKNGVIYPLPKHIAIDSYKVTPRNAGQKFAIHALLAPPDEVPLVILKGPAGTAKTFLSIAAALDQVVNVSVYDHILITRPNIKFDDDIGYLKGGEEEKIEPLIRPFKDNLECLCKLKEKSNKDGIQTGTTYVQELFGTGIITAQAMAYMRGRSIANSYVIIDEAQNMNPMQAFGIISRIGDGSKVILAGDPEQIDNPELDTRNNGLSYASECMRNSPLCAQITFGKDECVRSKLALEAIKRMSGKIIQT